MIAAWRLETAAAREAGGRGVARSGRPSWTWTAAVAGSAAAMVATFVAQVGVPWQPIAALVFLAIGPGASLVPLIGLGDRDVELMLVIPVSFSVAALTSAALFYRGVWSGGRELVLLLAVCLLGLAGQHLVAWRRASTGAPR